MIQRTIVALCVSTVTCLLGLGTEARGTEPKGQNPSAEDPSGFVITFESIPERIRRNNPDLAAVRLKVKEANGWKVQAGRWSNPAIELGLSGSGGFRERTTEVGIVQSVPLTGRLGLETEISNLRTEVASAEIADLERHFVAEAQAALVDVLAIRQQRELRRQQAELSNQFADFVGKVAARGELSPIDAGQARLEAIRLASEVRQLRADEIAATGRLKPLLGMDPFESVNILGELLPAELPSHLIEPERRSGYQAAALEAESASIGVRLERARRFDDIEAGIAVALDRAEDAPEGLESEVSLGFRVSLPLPFWNRNQGGIQVAEARAERKRRELEALAHNIRHEAETARREMVEWNELLLNISSELLPLADKQAADAERAYREGLGDLQAVLRAREQQLQLGASRIDALRNFHHARVRFVAAVAKP